MLAEFEAFLFNLAPDFQAECRGLIEEEILEIEEIAGQELPLFYRWFLSKMGCRVGRLPEQLSALNGRSVIDAYDRGEVDVDPPLLFIGRLPDPLMPLEIFYDLGHRTRDDALVVSGVAGDELSNDSETLREWVASIVFTKMRVNHYPQQCRGWLEDSSNMTYREVINALDKLGFSSALETGPFCALYQRHDSAIACGMDPDPDSGDLLNFYLGGPDVQTLRSILGGIVTESSLNIEISRWTPAVAGGDSKAIIRGPRSRQ